MADVSDQSSYLLENIISSAIQNRASDIHFEPKKNSIEIRFRIDGILQKVETFEKAFQSNIINRIKVLSGMDISNQRMPQDGHYEMRLENAIYNIRISSLPTIYGEAVVMRILNRDAAFISLEKLGMMPDQLKLVETLISNYSGMVLTTGPTGSGKTNLLYSIINKLNSPKKNIIALEDPVEYQMEGTRQIEINESTGLTFSKALRSVVRQDPDVIMVGEIRDMETLQMAIQSALTGILVFTSFHTFDIPALVLRFLEFGVAKSIIAQSIKGVISTRLVRIICNNCKEEVSLDSVLPQLDPYTLNYLKTRGSDIKICRGRGCEHCRNTGYKGRTGIFEIVYFDKEMQSAIIEQKPASFIYELIKLKNIKSLRDTAIEKALSNITTFEEINRILGIEV